MDQRLLNCLHCPRPVAFLNEEQLKIHLRKNFNCLAFKCEPCSDRFATHGELRQHYLAAHGLRATREQLMAEKSEQLLAGRRNVEVYIAAAFSQQRGEVIDLDSATIYTADYAGNPMAAPPRFPEKLVEHALPLRTPTIGTAQLQETLGGMRRPQLPAVQDEGAGTLGDGEGNGVPIIPLLTQSAQVAPSQPQQQERAPQQQIDEGEGMLGDGESNGVLIVPLLVQPAQLAQRPVPTQPQQLEGAQQQPIVDGGDYECQMSECGRRVPNGYPTLRQHAIRHAGPGAIHSQPDRRQRLLQEFMIRCFPNSPVQNDMTCLVCKYVERGPLDQAMHLQTIHVQKSHLGIEDLAVRCPVDDCPIREQPLHSLKELKDHLKLGHKLASRELTGEVKRRYKETSKRLKEMTKDLRATCFPFTPTRRL